MVLETGDSMRPIMLAAAAFLSIAAPQAAQAAWLEASSDHFVIYADDSERAVGQFADRLERYHSALALLTGSSAAVPSPSNRVTVFVVSDVSAVKRLFGEGGRYVGGFYIPRAGGSVAFVPRRTDLFGDGNGAMTTLLHEYAHHFLISSNSQPLPRWIVEGSAEFFSSTSFANDGSMKVGRAAVHRAYDLFNARDVQAADLLDSSKYDKRKNKGYDAFYGKSWLMYHYLTFEASRQGQLQTYVTLIAKGKPWRTAALEAFGDFEKLEMELDSYLLRPRMNVLSLSASRIPPAKVSIRRMGPGETAMMPIRLRSDRGVDRESAQAVLAQARPIAARFPNDASVLASLAEAEYDAGNDKEAIAAADAALTIDPGKTEAYVQKGFALFRMAASADDRPAAYKRAMMPFIKLNRIENDHPMPLIYFYRSQVGSGEKPTELALSGLQRASDLAPFDSGLRINLATALLKQGKKEQARDALTPVAFDPHGGGMSSGARALLTRLDNDPSWNGEDADAVLVRAAKEPDDAAVPEAEDKTVRP